MVNNFSPADVKAAAEAKLPVQVYIQLEKEEYKYRAWLRLNDSIEFATPKRGRPRTRSKYVAPIVIQGNSPLEVEQKQIALHDVLGPKARGNKRLGHQRLYLDLLESFWRLRHCGITLPKGGNLSAKAVRGGVGLVLKAHYYTDRTVDELEHDFNERRRLGKVMKSVFARVADSVNRFPFADELLP